MSWDIHWACPIPETHLLSCTQTTGLAAAHSNRCPETMCWAFSPCMVRNQIKVTVRTKSEVERFITLTAPILLFPFDQESQQVVQEQQQGQTTVTQFPWMLHWSLGETWFSLKTGMFCAKPWALVHVHVNLSPFTVSHFRQMWMTTTQPPFTTRRSASNLPNVGAQVDAAYDIPTSGAVYILTGTVMGSLQSIT